MRSPAAVNTRIPGTMALRGKRSIAPSAFTTEADDDLSPSRLAAALEARVRICSSRSRPMSRKARSVMAASK